MVEEEFKEEETPQSESKVLIYFLVTIITLPVFLILRNLIPDLNWPIYLDSIILFILIWGALNLLISPFKKLVYLLVVIIVLVLLYGSIFGEYGIGRFVTDYKNLISNMKESDAPISTLKEALTPDNTYEYQEIVEKVNVPELVENKSDKLANGFNSYIEAYPKYENLIKCLSVFKETKAQWVYIKDLDVYHADAIESLESMSGDMDDYAILMCALIKSMGEEVRIKNVDGIFHPELCIGSKEDKSRVKRLIKTDLFSKESKNQEVEFDSDTEGRIWLSLSYYGNFPGRAISKKGIEEVSSEIISLSRK